VNPTENSTAIDHINLFRRPEELVDPASPGGFAIESYRLAPAGSYTVPRLRHFAVSLSRSVVGRKRP
jgi:hypothetical protein